MIERLVRRRGMRGQFRFASEANMLLRPSVAFLSAKSHRGLHLLARDAEALAAPLLALRAEYGARVEINEGEPGKPIVEARIGFEKRNLEAVRHAVRRRGANPSEEYLGVHYVVLRCQASLARLLGLPLELQAITAGRISQQFLVRGYA